MTSPQEISLTTLLKKTSEEKKEQTVELSDFYVTCCLLSAQRFDLTIRRPAGEILAVVITKKNDGSYVMHLFPDCQVLTHIHQTRVETPLTLENFKRMFKMSFSTLREVTNYITL